MERSDDSCCGLIGFPLCRGLDADAPWSLQVCGVEALVMWLEMMAGGSSCRCGGQKGGGLKARVGGQATRSSRTDGRRKKLPLG